MLRSSYDDCVFDSEERNDGSIQRSLVHMARKSTCRIPVARSAACSLHREVEIAIIGNGPAGIFLSLVLSGYWPYFTGIHPNNYLRQKLSEHPERSILEQDLQYLSDGLEGRSNNPVAVLFDTLMRPNADIGEEHPPSLRWEYRPTKAVPHVVIGTGKPGGTWHEMQPDIQTLSLASWLDLPKFRFLDWKSESTPKESVQDKSCRKRALVGDVACYYSDYVREMELESNFINGVNVTQVTERQQACRSTCSPSPISSVSSSSSINDDPPTLLDVDENRVETINDPAKEDGLPVQESCLDVKFIVKDELVTSEDSECYISDADDVGVFCCGANKCSRYKWYMRGSRNCRGHKEAETMTVAAKKVVLACGVGGAPKRLCVPGEEASYIKHQYSDCPPALNKLTKDSQVVVVGAGLTAADAVLLALSLNVKVIHVFRQDPNDPSLVYRKLTPKMYNEYCHVSNLMQGKEINSNYVPLAQHSVCKFKSDGVAILQAKDGTEIVLTVSLAMVLIGSEADLGFLPREIVSSLGIHPDKPIHHKHNPITVDPSSFECVNVPSLYALGPLVGDNFVRFVLGSALGAAQSLSNAVG